MSDSRYHGPLRLGSRTCDECGEEVDLTDLVPRRKGPEPWHPTLWICSNCDDAAAQEDSEEDEGCPFCRVEEPCPDHREAQPR